MSNQQLIDILSRQFSPGASKHINATVTLATRAGQDNQPVLSFLIDQMTLEFVEGNSVNADITLIADELDTFERILTGKQHLVSAFMQGNFQSDGYLILVFQVLSVFTAKMQDKQANTGPDQSALR